MAVHVEDHPLEYFDFEGVIPGGQYGAGDVIVWDWGTWRIDDDADPIAATEAGDLHFDLFGEKLSGHFALVRRRGRDGKEEWLLLHKHDEHAVPGWNAEDYPRSVKSGRTNDEVKAAPAASWSSSAIWAAPNADELKALDSLGAKGTWLLGGRTLQLTNLDKVLFPAQGRTKALTKRDLIRHYTTVAPAMLPYLVDRPINMHRYPDGAGKPGFWHKQLPNHAPDWLQRWHNEEAEGDEAKDYLVIDSAAALAWVANYGAIELHPWTSTTAHPHQPTWAMVDIDPGDSSTFDDVVMLARLHRTALDHMGVRAMPKVTGKRGIQIWVPVAAGLTFDDTQGVGGASLAHRRRGRTRHDQLGVGGCQTRWTDPPRLHAERDQQDLDRPVQRPSGRRRAGVGAHRLGRARRSRSATGSMESPHDRRATVGRRRPTRAADRPAAAPAEPVSAHAIARKVTARALAVIMLVRV